MYRGEVRLAETSGESFIDGTNSSFNVVIRQWYLWEVNLVELRFAGDGELVGGSAVGRAPRVLDEFGFLLSGHGQGGNDGDGQEDGEDGSLHVGSRNLRY